MGFSLNKITHLWKINKIFFHAVLTTLYLVITQWFCFIDLYGTKLTAEVNCLHCLILLFDSCIGY